jgi:CspA family cold shock protein
MASGIVRTYHQELGYGFIRPDDGGTELTVYYDSIVEHRELEPGDKVEYDTTVQEFRPVAERVRPA